MSVKAVLVKLSLSILLITSFASVTAQTVLRIMSSTIVESPEGDVEQAIADAFMAANPDIEIEFIGTPMNDMFQVLTTSAIGGELPDIFTNTAEFSAQAQDLGIAADLNDLFSEDFLAGFYPTAIEEGTVNGELIFLPWFTVPVGVLYRADWFEEAGLAGPQTWDEFVGAAQALTQDTNNDGQNDRWGFAMVGTKNGSGFFRFTHLLRSQGAWELYKDANGNWQSDLGSEGMVNALAIYKELHDAGLVPPGVTETGYGEAVSLMASDKTAMMVTGPHTIGAILAQNPDLEGQIHSVPIPLGVDRSASLGVGGFSVAATSEHKEAAARYLEFLVSTENMLEWNRVTGRMPAQIEAGEQPQISGPVYAGFVEAIQISKPMPQATFYTQIQEVMGEAYQAVLVGGVSPADAAAEAGVTAAAIIADAE
ncbi:MAG: sugar ABC transporter substrate-binding protein [Deinococcota bacterium]